MKSDNEHLVFNLSYPFGLAQFDIQLGYYNKSICFDLMDMKYHVIQLYSESMTSRKKNSDEFSKFRK